MAEGERVVNDLRGGDKITVCVTMTVDGSGEEFGGGTRSASRTREGTRRDGEREGERTGC